MKNEIDKFMKMKTKISTLKTQRANKEGAKSSILDELKNDKINSLEELGMVLDKADKELGKLEDEFKKRVDKLEEKYNWN